MAPTFLSENITSKTIGHFVVSAAFADHEGGVSSEWVVSSKSGTYLQVMSVCYVPVGSPNATTAVASKPLFDWVSDTLTTFVGQTYGGLSVPLVRPIHKGHVAHHLTRHLPWMDRELSLLEKTASQYTLAKQLGGGAPGVLIASVEGLESVRTAHDRIARAKEAGLL
jgi:hypothetical protein